jgi:PAS domain S-box-containing protein
MRWSFAAIAGPRNREPRHGAWSTIGLTTLAVLGAIVWSRLPSKPPVASFFGGGFMPHGMCYLWNAPLLIANVLSDGSIALAYFTIAGVLLYFVRRREDLPLRGAIAMFGLFIVACGTTHVLDIWTIWHPSYWFATFVKAFTAVASVTTAIMLVPLIPKVLKFRSPLDLEKANLQLEKRYQRLLNTAQEGIWTLDGESRVTFVNRKLAAMVGCEQTEMLGRHVSEFVPESEAEGDGEDARFEQSRERRLAHKDGTEVWVASSNTSIYDEDGSSVGLLTMFADVTERRQADQELLESKQRYQSLAEAMPQMVWTATASGELNYYSARWDEYTGLTQEQLYGAGWDSIVHPDDLARSLDAWTHSLASGTPYEAEHRLRGANGTYRWFLGRALPISDDAGSLVQWLGTATDIDDQKRTLESQRRLTEQLQAVIEATDRLSYSLDTQEALTTLCDAVVPRFADWISVNLVEPEGRIRNVAFEHRDPRKEEAVRALRSTYYIDPKVRGAIVSVIETQRPFLTSNYSSTYADFAPAFPEKRWAMAELGLASVVAVPLMVRGRLIGVLAAAWSQTDRRYDDAEVPFFEELAKRTAVAFDEAARHSMAYVSEETTRRIMQSSEDCIAILSLDARLMAVNKRGQNAFATPETHLEIGCAWLDCWRAADRDAASAALAAARSGATGTYQGCIARDDGAPQWWDVVVTPILSVTGVPAQLLAVSRDITRQKHHESALEAVASQYRAFANAIPAIAFTMTPNGTLEFVNGRWTEYTGHSPEEGLAKGLISVTHTAERRILAEAWACLESGEPTQAEIRLRRASDGVYRWHLVRAVPIHDSEGKIVQWFGTGTDIDDQKQAEAAIAQARDAALNAATVKSQFVATMSHEIRTPISGVIGMTELLLITALSEEQREYANVVRDSGQSLLRVINDILDYSKLDAGKLQLESVPFDVESQIKSVTDLLRAQIVDKRIALTYGLQADVPDTLIGDPGRVRQILVNLVGNAVKFTPAGGSVHVRVSRVRDDGPEARVRFEIEDSGVGISPEIRPRLFEAFSQGDGSTTRKYGGTGLGLSICKQLVTLMDGTIGVESVFGQGATFWFTIEFGRPSDASLAPSAPASAHDERRMLARTRSHRILLVEDNEINTLLAQRQFERLGFAISTVSNGIEALAAVRTTPFDLIFMDCHMPEMDGFEATREIRRLERAGMSRVAIVAMTADAQVEDRTACLAAGMDDYLSKPSTLGQLYGALERWLPQAAEPDKLTP